MKTKLTLLLLIGINLLLNSGCETTDIENSLFSNTREFSKVYDKNEYGFEDANLRMKFIPDFNDIGTVYFDLDIELNPDNYKKDPNKVDYEGFWEISEELDTFVYLKLFDKDGFKIEEVILPRKDISFDQDIGKLKVLSENTFFEVGIFRSISEFEIDLRYYSEEEE